MYEYAVAIFVICSFPSGPHVNFVYIGLYIEGEYRYSSPVHACCVGLCACKQLTVFISSSLCSKFLSVLHKDEPMLWFVLHAAQLCLHVNISLHPDDLIMY